MKFLSNFIALFFRNLFNSTRRDTRMLGGGEFWRNEFFDTNPATARNENDMTGDLNYRTGRFDSGNDPIGWYADE